jgi:hypothetical protein
MKPSPLLYALIATVGLAPWVRADSILLFDDFNGTALNTSAWQASTPVAGSSVAVGGGNLVLTDGGRTLSRNAFPTAIDIDLSFRFTGSPYDSFKIVTRTDGSTTNSAGNFDNGIVASFRMMSDPSDPEGTADNVALYDENYPTSQTELAVGTFAMTTDQDYEIRLIETSTSVSLFINDFSTPLLAADTTDAYGGQIGFSNREGAAAGSAISDGSQVEINYVEVVGLPDTGSTAAGLFVACTLLISGAVGTARRMARQA